MGCTITAEYEPVGGEFTFADGTTFGLYQPDDRDWSRRGGVMFRVGDLEAAVKLYKSRGGKFEGDGAIEDTPVCRFAVAEDSEGNYFLLHTRKH